jgi:hypothetical protein
MIKERGETIFYLILFNQPKPDAMNEKPVREHDKNITLYFDIELIRFEPDV